MVLPIFSFSSCSKDDESSISTFTIINNSEMFETKYEYLDGTMYEVVAFEFDGSGNNIGQINIDNIPYGGGKSKPIQVQESCTKVQISFKMLPPESPYYDLSLNPRLYIASLGVIKKGGNINIILDEETMTTKNPSTKSSTKIDNAKFIDCLKSVQ